MRRKSFACGRERSLPLVYMGQHMAGKTKEISVFVDESGSFESTEESSRFYLVCMVFHDQSNRIDDEVGKLGLALANYPVGPDHCAHIGPLIRREEIYAGMSRDERQRIFGIMMAFMRRIDISYKCFVIDKHFNNRETAVHDVLLQDINRFLVDNAHLFNSYDKLKVYYDNGQSQMNRLLHEAFAMFSSTVEFVSNVQPEKYRLFQVADLLCTLELIDNRLEAGLPMTKSEYRFFGGEHKFRKNIRRQFKSKMLVAH